MVVLFYKKGFSIRSLKHICNWIYSISYSHVYKEFFYQNLMSLGKIVLYSALGFSLFGLGACATVQESPEYQALLNTKNAIKRERDTARSQVSKMGEQIEVYKNDQQEIKGRLSKLEERTPLIAIPILCGKLSFIVEGEEAYGHITNAALLRADLMMANNEQYPKNPCYDVISQVAFEADNGNKYITLERAKEVLNEAYKAIKERIIPNKSSKTEENKEADMINRSPS